MRATNHAEAEWQRKVKEDERKKKQRKLLAWERGEETDSDNNEEEDDDEVVDDTERDGLESEDMLIGTRSSLQGLGPFPYHGGESISVRPTETGQTIGPPSEPAGMGGSVAAPEVPTEEGGSTTMPLAARETSPFAWEQGVGSKWPRPDEAEQGSGGFPPKHVCCPTAPM